jgi:hypothetical protein
MSRHLSLFAVTALGLTVCACACPCAEKAPATAAQAEAAPTPLGVGPAAVALKTCSAPLVPAQNGLIDDAEDDDARVTLIEGRDGYWWTAHDDLGSVIEPSGSMRTTEGGAGNSKRAMRVTGKNAQGAPDKAWGTVLGFRLAQSKLYDASKYAGISFMAKAGDKSSSLVRLKVADVNTHPDGKVCKEACYNDFGKDYALTREWQKFEVSFADMKQQEGWGDPRPPAITPSELVQVSFHFSTPGADFDVWIDDVKFLDCP